MGLESLMNRVPDQLLHRTFGGCVTGKGFVQAEAAGAAQSLKTAAPTRRLDVAIHMLTACPATPDQWLEKVTPQVPKNSWQNHLWQNHFSRVLRGIHHWSACRRADAHRQGLIQ
ncbi:MAG: DUF5703 domain-containing protein [Verrucomicrobia bacterium]|nr:DUF5703 domain-containing protein [Verrucomicrobiota bacterium]